MLDLIYIQPTPAARSVHGYVRYLVVLERETEENLICHPVWRPGGIPLNFGKESWERAAGTTTVRQQTIEAAQSAVSTLVAEMRADSRTSLSSGTDIWDALRSVEKWLTELKGVPA